MLPTAITSPQIKNFIAITGAEKHPSQSSPDAKIITKQIIPIEVIAEMGVILFIFLYFTKKSPQGRFFILFLLLYDFSDCGLGMFLCVFLPYKSAGASVSVYVTFYYFCFCHIIYFYLNFGLNF